jgi:hypothetical protein
MKREPNLVRRNPRGAWLAVFFSAATSVTACGEAESYDSEQNLCREGTSSVVLTNATGQGIQDIQIRPLEEVGLSQTLVDPQSKLPSGGEVGWVACASTAQALTVTLADGTQQEFELPGLDPSTNRLRMTPKGVVIDPPPPSKPPVDRDLQTEPLGSGSTQPRR